MDFTKYEVTLAWPTVCHGYDKEEFQRTVKYQQFYKELQEISK